MSICRDSDLTARITGLEVRLARRSAEVEMLKAAVAACQDARRTPSPPDTPQVGHKNMPVIAGTIHRLLSICPPLVTSLHTLCCLAAGCSWSAAGPEPCTRHRSLRDIECCVQAPLRPVPVRVAPDPMPRLLSADSAGQFVVSLDGRVVLGSGPYAGKFLSQVQSGTSSACAQLPCRLHYHMCTAWQLCCCIQAGS
jgi:hypothetical protein